MDGVNWSILSFISYRHVVYVFLGYFIYRLIHRLFILPYLLSPLRDVPGPPIGNPIFGRYVQLAAAATDMNDVRHQWVQKYGGVVRLVGPFGVENIIFLAPEALHQILVKDWVDYPRPTYLRHILGMVAGYGLLTVTGEEHRLMRKAMNPAFSIPNLMNQTDMYYEPIDGLVEMISSQIAPGNGPGSVIPMYGWLSKVTLDIICETAFGYRADSLHNPDNELAIAYEHLLDLQSEKNLAALALAMITPGGPRFLASEWAYRHVSWFKPFSMLGPLTTLLESMHTIREISKKMLAEKINDLSAISADDMHTKKDIMSLLVRARQADLAKDGFGMTDEAMVDQVLTFLGAGHETTASGLSWTLWLLANNIEAQNRLREEVAPIIAETPHPGYRTLKDMKYLDCVVMEGLRVMPPVPFTVRRSNKTDYVQGVLVPKGTLMHICIAQINTWTAIWGEDAQTFRPERWLDLPKAYNPTFSFMSFIAGPHGCIGKTMAIIEMKAVLAALIANFEFTPAHDGQVAHHGVAITMKPSDGMPLKIRRVASGAGA